MSPHPSPVTFSHARRPDFSLKMKRRAWLCLSTLCSYQGLTTGLRSQALGHPSIPGVDSLRLGSTRLKIQISSGTVACGGQPSPALGSHGEGVVHRGKAPSCREAGGPRMRTRGPLIALLPLLCGMDPTLSRRGWPVARVFPHSPGGTRRGKLPAAQLQRGTPTL